MVCLGTSKALTARSHQKKTKIINGMNKNCTGTVIHFPVLYGTRYFSTYYNTAFWLKFLKYRYSINAD